MSRFAPTRVKMVSATAAGLLLTACGGGGSAGFAGMTRDEALFEAHNAVAYEVNSPSSDVYRAKPTLAKLVQGSNRAGGEAWVGVFEERGGPSVCFWLWTDVPSTLSARP